MGLYAPPSTSSLPFASSSDGGGGGGGGYGGAGEMISLGSGGCDDVPGSGGCGGSGGRWP